MSKYLIAIYLAVVFIILAIIQIGIRQEGGPPLVEVRADSKEKGYTPLAKKLERVAAESKKAEMEVTQAKIEDEFESMVFVPAGEFTMGSHEGPNDQEPVRKVYLDGFYIDKYEVAFAPFYAFVRSTGHRKPRLAGYLSGGVTEDMPLLIKPFNPVVGVSWDDAVDYCGWKGKRLPTEAEWEKAAKGTDERKWPWGNEERSEYANLIGDDGSRYTAAVTQFTRDVSPYGVYGLAGNVMEWVSDWYQEDYYRLAPASNPKGPETGMFKMGQGGGNQALPLTFFEIKGKGFKAIRGASWHDSIKRAQTSVRFKTYPEYRDVTIGFRCAKS